MSSAIFRRPAAILSGVLLASLLNVTTADAGILPIPCDPTGLLGDCTAPETTFTSTPGVAETTLTTASFSFITPEDDATFECWLSGNTNAHVWQDCTDIPEESGQSVGSSSYTDLQPGNYEFRVRATDSLDNVEETPAIFTWTVKAEDPTTQPPDDPNAPETVLTEQPKYWHLYVYASFGYKANKDIDHFSCTFDDKPVTCPTTDTDRGAVDFYPGKITRGTHTFKVAAVDASGRIDQTPATSIFTRPMTVLQIKNWSKGWTQKNELGYFNDVYSETSKKGASVIQYQTDFYRAALLVTKCPQCGAIDIYWGKELVKHVNLYAKKKLKKRLIPVVSFRKRHNGRLKVVVTSKGKPVILEGMGFSAVP